MRPLLGLDGYVLRPAFTGGFLLVLGFHCLTTILASMSELSVGAQPQASISSPDAKHSLLLPHKGLLVLGVAYACAIKHSFTISLPRHG